MMKWWEAVAGLAAFAAGLAFLNDAIMMWMHAHPMTAILVGAATTLGAIYGVRR